MENSEMKVESGKLGISIDVGKTESQQDGASLEEQISFIDIYLKLYEQYQVGTQYQVGKHKNPLPIVAAIKENLIAIRNIQASGQTLADKEREAGVSFDSMVAVFKCFIEDVWKMRYAQKDKTANAEQLSAYEQEIDEQLAILVPERKAEAKLTVLGQEGEDYQLNN
jgi:hypothetical protein